MKFNDYLHYFEEILKNPNPELPYSKADYFNYTKLNWSRQQRWLKTGEVNLQLAESIRQITKGLHWIVITEPWCGDAAHIVPFIYKFSILNPKIELDIQLRDQPPFLIDRYLTNGGKSIPKLIIRDEHGQDLHVWGPRPQECALLYSEMMGRAATFEEIKLELQRWYNEDRGAELQKEILAITESLR